MTDWRGSSENETVAYLVWSDVFDESFSKADLAYRLSTCSRHYVLRGLSIVGTVLTNTGGLIGRGQRDVAAEFLDGVARQRALALFDSGGIGALVHPDAVLTATRLALRHATDDGAEDSTIFARLLLGANELVGEREIETVEDAAAVVLHDHAFLGHEQLRYLIPRYHELLATEEPKPPDTGPTLSQMFEAATGGIAVTTFLGYSAVLLALFGRYRSADTLNEHAYGSELAELEVRSQDPDEFRRYRALIEIELPSAVRDANRGPETPAPFRYFVGIRGRPQVRLNETESVPVWLPWIQAKIAGDSRWMIATNLVGDGDAVARFDSLLGIRFEAYVFSLLARCYQAEGPQKVLHAPLRYETERGGEESNDATLLTGDAALFFEMTITHPRFEDMWQGDPAAFRAFVRDRLVSGSTQKLAKLSRRIEDFNRGRLRYGTAEPSRIHDIYPVLVTLLPWPIHAIIWQLIAPDLLDLDPSGGPELDGQRIHRPIFVSAEELEMIEESIRSGDLDLPSLLRDWQSSAMAGSSLKNYLLLERGFQEVLNSHLAAEYRRVIESLRLEASRLVRLDEAGE